MAKAKAKADVTRTINHWFGLVEDKWARRYHGMQRCLKAIGDHGELPVGDKTIRSALYGDIHLSPFEVFVLDLPVVQRLREVSQMGMLPLVYPEAKHSRFDHSLGVLFNIQKMSAELGIRVDSRDYRNLTAAAILHDIGHGPYSHAAEVWQDSLGLQAVPDFGNRKAKTAPAAYKIYGNVDTSNAARHEANALNIIFDHPVLVNMINRGISNGNVLRIGTPDGPDSEPRTDTLGLRSLLKKLRTDPAVISSMIVGDTNAGRFVPLINGPVDADKLDYYQRDAYFAGAGLTGTDVEYIIHNMRLGEDKHGVLRVCWPPKAMNDLLHALFSREFFYAGTGLHPVSRVANALLAVAFLEAYRFILLATGEDGQDTPYRLLAYLPFVEDGDIRSLLSEVAAMRIGDPDVDTSAQIVEGLLERVMERDLFKRATLSGDERGKLNERFQKEADPQPVKKAKRQTKKPLSVDPGMLYMVSHSRKKTADPAENRLMILDWAWKKENRNLNDKGFSDKIYETWGKIKRGNHKLTTENAIYVLQPGELARDTKNIVATPLWVALGTEARKLSDGLVAYQSTLSQVQFIVPSGLAHQDCCTEEIGQWAANFGTAYHEFKNRPNSEWLLEYKAQEGHRLGPPQPDDRAYMDFLLRLVKKLK